MFYDNNHKHTVYNLDIRLMETEIYLDIFFYNYSDASAFNSFAHISSSLLSMPEDTKK